MKPIIYSELKVGDKVVHLDGALGKVIAVTPEANDDYRITVFWGGRAQDRGAQGQITSYTEDGRFTPTTERVVFLAPKPKVKKELWLVLLPNGSAVPCYGGLEQAQITARYHCPGGLEPEIRLIEWEVEQ